MDQVQFSPNWSVTLFPENNFGITSIVSLKEVLAVCTYHVYDRLYRLRLVIQPAGVNSLTTSSWTVTTDIQNEQCFMYVYDGRNRLIRKKVPGAGPVWSVYDARDRVVMFQDSALRARKAWIYSLYDELDRVKWYDEYSAAFYDNYTWRGTYGNPLTESYHSYPSGLLYNNPGTWPYPQNNAQTKQLRGMSTGNRSKVVYCIPTSQEVID